MIYYIKEAQLKANLKKYDIQEYDKEVLERVNQLHQQVVTDLMQQKKKQQEKQQKQQQRGGRVSFPVDYFGGNTTNLSQSTPAFTNISTNDVSIRQEIPLSDASQVLGTDKAMVSGMPTAMAGGSAKSKFQVSQTASQDIVRSVAKRENASIDNKQQFVQVSKQKFENVIDEVLKKAKKQGSTLSKSNLDQVLQQKKYKAFKA